MCASRRLQTTHDKAIAIFAGENFTTLPYDFVFLGTLSKRTLQLKPNNTFIANS
jgi:hypothetical protein